MKTQFAISLFGSVAALAQALGIRDKAVYQWGDMVPELRRYQLEDKYAALIRAHSARGK